MSTSPLVLVLAAGLGTRMKSDTAKVLHRVNGRPLVVWPVELARALGARKTVVVLGHQLEAVRAVLDARFPGALAYARQERQLGTGHAARQGLPALSDEAEESPVLILYGDVPLLSRETVDALIDARARAAAPLAMVSTRPASPRGYGRVVRDAAARVERIVEEKDASEGERAIGEVNAGIYCITLGFLRAGVADLSPQNAQGELYLTDLVARAARDHVLPVVEAPFDEVAGVNDRVELARLDAVARRATAERWMRAGVTMVAPETISIDADVAAIGRDVELGAGVALRGAGTRIGDRVRIGAGSILADTVVGDDAVIEPYSILTESRVGARAVLGPFAHLRPGTSLERD